MKFDKGMVLFLLVLIVIGIVLINLNRDKQNVGSPIADQSSLETGSNTLASSTVSENEEQVLTSLAANTEQSASQPQKIVRKPADKGINMHPDEDSILRFFKGKASGSWRVQVDPASKRIFRVLGGEIPQLTGSMESVKEFMAEVGPEFGVPADQVTEDIRQGSSGAFALFDSMQTVDGIPVFEGWFRVFGNPTSQAGFMFNNNLWPVDLEEVIIPNPTRNSGDQVLDAQGAEAVLRVLYGTRLKAIKSTTGPVIWAQSSPHEIAYVFDIAVENDDLKVVIGAQSSLRLLERSMRMY